MVNIFTKKPLPRTLRKVYEAMDKATDDAAGFVPADGSATNTKLAADVKVGSLAALTTTAKTSVQAAINEIVTAVAAIPVNGTITNAKLATDVKVGSVAALITTEKSNVVGAINEIVASALIKVATITGINAKAVAVTTLYTVPAGKTFIPAFVIIRCTAFTVGSKSIQAIASFGGNSATYDDFLNSQTYTIAAIDTFIKDGGEDSALAVQAAEDVFKISIETGSDATTETWAVDLFGYLV